ncbi:hypothetical protein ACJX0J_036031 [Zea mays]
MQHGLERWKSDDREDQRKTLEDSLKTYKDHDYKTQDKRSLKLYEETQKNEGKLDAEEHRMKKSFKKGFLLIEERQNKISLFDYGSVCAVLKIGLGDKEEIRDMIWIGGQQPCETTQDMVFSSGATGIDRPIIKE